MAADVERGPQPPGIEVARQVTAPAAAAVGLPVEPACARAGAFWRRAHLSEEL